MASRSLSKCEFDREPAIGRVFAIGKLDAGAIRLMVHDTLIGVVRLTNKRIAADTFMFAWPFKYPLTLLSRNNSCDL